jgi:hypothetical protein
MLKGTEMTVVQVHKGHRLHFDGKEAHREMEIESFSTLMCHLKRKDSWKTRALGPSVLDEAQCLPRQRPVKRLLTEKY